MVKPNVADNIAALKALTATRATGKPTDEQLDAMRLWRGWGALPKVFDRTTDTDLARELRDLLGDNWAAARRTVLNAHYTDPKLVELLWSAAHRAGITGGHVLEIGCGRGDIIDGAPYGDWVFHGIELDPTTAAICQYTHPDADIVTAGIERVDITHGSYDLVIGNVPFSTIAPVAPDNPHRYPLHDYCITRALDAVRPGGIVALITSRYTLDKRDDTARCRWAAVADMIAVWRLTDTAHKEYAGTSVVTDILVFQRRLPDAQPCSIDFCGTATVNATANTAKWGAEPAAVNVTVNTAFAGDNPAGFMFGTIRPGGMYSADDFTVTRPHWQPITRNGRELRGDPDIFAAAIAEIPRVATERTPADPHPTVTHRRARHQTPVIGDTPEGLTGESAALYEIGAAATAVLTAERDGDYTRADSLRSVLAARYRDYVTVHGRIRRPRRGAAKAAWAALMDHNVWPIVGALENRDSDTGDISEAALLTRPVIQSPPVKHRAETALEAVAVSVAETGGIRVPRIAELLDLSEPDAVRACDGLIFFDPDTERWEPAPVYLSGNIRQKLVTARIAADNAPERFDSNIAALEAVAPPWVPIGDIHLTLANPLVTPHIADMFISGLGYTAIVTHVAGKWSATQGTPGYQGRGWQDYNPDGTGFMVVLRNALNGTTPIVKDQVTGEINQSATDAAADAVDRLNDRFAQWVISTPELTERFEHDHNTRFNAHRTADFCGYYPNRVVGMASDFVLRDYQTAAVAAAVLTSGAALIGHPVGAGKTAVAAATVMEWLRIGRASRAMIVVPNALLEDFAIEWKHIFPMATILVGGSETSKRTRGQILADIASGAYPVTIIARSMFERLPSSHAAVQAWIDDETAGLRAALETAQQDGNKGTVKRVEKAIAALEARLERAVAADNKDGVIPFDLLGIDALVVDEMHGWKRLPITSTMPDMSDRGSQRAVDLAVKLHTMRARAGRSGPAVLGLTGTYVTNRVSEIWTTMRFLAPDVLESAGTDQFDAWAAVHAETVTTMEMNPTGSGWRQKARVARYQNMPELMGQVVSFASLMSAEELDIQRPDRETVIVTSEATPELAGFVEQLVERAEACTGRRTVEELKDDNMLKVVNDGRLAALDPRLVGVDTPGRKICDAADRIAAVWAQHRHNTYVTRDGEPSPNRGALQIVFCSLGIHTEPFSVWTELRQQLAGRGIPESRIRDSNEMTSPAKRAKLLADCRNGHVDVLIGSYERVGIGVNIQDRVIAIHELNPEWRPDIHIQGEGRGERYGNQNPRITVYRYVTEGSFDVYMWATLERKMRFVAQVASGNVLSRELPELDAEIFSFAQAKAAATGDPRHVELADADNELRKLRRLARVHDSEGRRRRLDADRFDFQADQWEQDADRFDTVLADTPTLGTVLRLDGEQLTYRQIANRLDGGPHRRHLTAGGAQFDISRRWGDAPWRIDHNYRLMFAGTPQKVMAEFADFVADPAGHVTAVRARAARLRAAAVAERDQPLFGHSERLAVLESTVARLTSELGATATATL